MSSKQLGQKILNIIASEEMDLIDKFWKLNKITKKQQSKRKLKTQKQMIMIAQEIIKIEGIEQESNFYPYYVKFANAKIEKDENNKELNILLE